MFTLLGFRGSSVSTQLEVLMLGGLRLRLGEREDAHFRTQKTAALLAYLALHPGRPHRREVLMELLWPDGEEAAARQSLSTALWALRQQLRALAPAGPDLFSTDRSTVTLSAGSIRTDVFEFQEALQSARAASTPEERIRCLSQAVRLYQGEFLPGLYDDWILTEQRRLAALYEQALAELCTLLEADRRYGAALEYAMRVAVGDPLGPEPQERVMRLYAAQGQERAALAHYRDYERLVRRELGQPPQPSLRELAREIEAGLSALPDADSPPPPKPPAPLQDSYVLRAVDHAFDQGVEARSSILLLKGPRGTGKTSLLGRGLGHAREQGALVVLTDLQSLSAGQLDSGDALLRALADSLSEQLELEKMPRDIWVPDLAPSLNLRRFMRRHVLGQTDRHIVWALDEVDRLFSRPFYGDVFGLFRSWHNERASDPDGPWSQLTLVLAYSTEAHLFMPDLDQSPFNVGVRLELEDLTPEQLGELNRALGEPLRGSAELSRFIARFGGHPYLAQRALRELARRRGDLGLLEETHHVFHDHLRAMLSALRQDGELCGVVRQLLRGEERLSEESVMRLRNAGLVTLDPRGGVRFRCGLYRDYLTQHLT